eukprot:842515-Amorphochlora_amoeboformis.AAC.1
MGLSDATQYHMLFRLLGNDNTRVSETVKAYEANGRVAGGNDNTRVSKTRKEDQAKGRLADGNDNSSVSKTMIKQK